MRGRLSTGTVCCSGCSSVLNIIHGSRQAILSSKYSVCILEDQTDNLVQCMAFCCLQKVLQFGDPLSEAILQLPAGHCKLICTTATDILVEH